MKRIPAKALLITIVIVLIITSITSSLVLFYYYYQQVYNNTMIGLQLNANNEAAIQLLLQEKFAFTDERDSAIIYDLYHNGEQMVSVKKYRWGGFVLIATTAADKHLVKRLAMLTGNPLKNDSSALYLSNQGSPLVVAGTAGITGNCYLPASGIKKAYFEGRSYQRENAVTGEQRVSEKELPGVDSILISYLTSLPEKIRSGQLITERYIPGVNDTIVQSFFDRPRYFYNEEAVHLNHVFIKGQVIIASSKAIIVHKNAVLKDVILVAPRLITNEGVKGCFQMMASDSILIGKRNTLYYPTMLFLLQTDSSAVFPYFKTDSGTYVSGAIFAFTPMSDRNNLKMALGSASQIAGSVYCNGLAKIAGTIHGELICHKLYLNTARGYYLNHLYNAELNRIKLHPEFVNHCLLNRHNHKKNVKWLY